jgi:hypothetical protein
MRLRPVAFGLAFGIIWGLCVFIMAIIGIWSSWCGELMRVLSSLYVGTASTWLGAIIGLVWGFVDGFIGGWLVALLYNAFAGPSKAT